MDVIQRAVHRSIDKGFPTAAVYNNMHASQRYRQQLNKTQNLLSSTAVPTCGLRAYYQTLG